MSLTQYAMISKKDNQNAWGETLETARAVLGHLAEECNGVAQAQTADEITKGATQWAIDNGITRDRFFPKMVLGVLYRLAQGVAHALVAYRDSPVRFYVFEDAAQRLADERMQAHLAEEAEYAWYGMTCDDAGPGRPLRPCVRPGCPYGGGWEPPVGSVVNATFPYGSKCCGSCTGVRDDGGPMALAHGSSCRCVPWLGVPESDTRDLSWLCFKNLSALSEAVNRATGTARLSMLQWTCLSEPQGGSIIFRSTAVMEGAEAMSLQMSGPTRTIAKMRTKLGFLHLYKTVLEAAESGAPVDYAELWAEEAARLVRRTDEALNGCLDRPVRPRGQVIRLPVVTENDVDSSDESTDEGQASDSCSPCVDPAPSAPVDGADVRTCVSSCGRRHRSFWAGYSPDLGPQAEEATPVTSGAAPHIEEQENRRAARAQDLMDRGLGTVKVAKSIKSDQGYRVGSASGTYTYPLSWGMGPVEFMTSARDSSAAKAGVSGSVYGARTQLVRKASRPMCAVARHGTYIFATSTPLTSPATRIVPVRHLRAALTRDEQFRRQESIDSYSDSALLAAFLAATTSLDTKKHQGVPRFDITEFDASVMYPADQASWSFMRTDREPCLVVRMKTEQRRG